MPTDFDPYLSWLNIPKEEQPPHHYRLLGLELFENQPDKINEAVLALVTRLQDLSHGEHIESAQRLLNDAAKAKLCLTSKTSKFKYDLQLRKSLKQATATSQTPVLANSAANAATTPSPPALKPATTPAKPATQVQSKPAPANAANRTKKSTGRKANKKPQPSGMPGWLGPLLGGIGALLIGGLIVTFMLPKPTPESPTAAEDYFDADWKAPGSDNKKSASNNTAQLRDNKAAGKNSGKKNNGRKNNANKNRAELASNQKETNPEEKKMGGFGAPPPIEMPNSLSNYSPLDGSPVNQQLMDLNDGQALRKQSGQWVVVKGNVQKVGESNSGKTVYVWFSDGEKEKGRIFFTLSQAPELSKQWATELIGKKVTVTGVVDTRHAVGIKIKEMAQVEIE